MPMNDVVTLIRGEIRKDAEGYPVLCVLSQSDVFARVASPKRAQRDSALRHDYVATLSVTLHCEEYSREKHIEYLGKRYEVKQTYQLNSEEIELTCSDARC